ncbi:SWI/SNF-related matrix-associated actin-dependent regulator of chromatin subfamily A-like protein 1 [Platysternon megacephalum]|uniref:SWI/SNF-related matrix-associated actin-dependent regulator of chromatin subfamily A-like protein 1 n=1 Tax=Platysternon megacephalum TaxID=55544 RepID=A0A4D9E343_9SAUR|nr:SWI/SNF-related matrix-associated actin-dependent regulator of chromatin subfamily A-like protein 1 [Platysternon megacephalum]
MRVPGWSPAALLLAACLWRLPPGRGAAGTEEVIVGEAGKSVVLVCRNVSERADEVDWFHGDPGAVPPLFSSNATLPKDARLSLVDNSSLHISALRLQDGGNYTCKEVLNETVREHRVQLLVASGPSSVTVSISPAATLPNGTVYVDRRDAVMFSCASNSHPEPTMGWTFQPPSSAPETFTEVNGSSTVYTLQNLSLRFQGNYSCTARNPLSGRSQTSTKELLVYYPPPSVPRCWAQTAQVGLMLQLFCNWPGGYPHPVLQWTEEGRDLENSSWVVNATGTGDTHVETLSSSRLFHGKEFKCVGSHILKQERAELATCTVQIKAPSLATEPLKTCFVGGTVSLTCQVLESNPPARISWLRNVSQPEVEIQPGGRYLLTQEGSVSNLTIQNCSHDADEGYYVCKAENPVGLKEAYVSLTVKKPVNIVGVVGAVVILLLLGVLVISGIILYYNPLLCLKGSIFRNQDSNDVFVLVDSDGEEEEEEEREEEEATGNSNVHRVTALVNGNSAQAGYGYHFTESDSSELHSELSTEEVEREERPTTQRQILPFLAEMDGTVGGS